MSESTTDIKDKARRIIAQAAGISRLLKSGGNRIAAYNNLLEDEWSGRPSALNFLKESSEILENMLGLNSIMQTSLSDDLDLELLSVQPIVDGVASKQPKCANGVINTDLDVHSFVMTDVFMLQEALGDISSFIAEAPQCPELIISCFKTELTKDAVGILRTYLEPKEYVVISMARHSNLELFLDEYVAADDPRLADWRGDYASRMLSWLGVATLHNGELLVHRSGAAEGVILLLPLSSTVSDDNMKAHMVNGHPETILLVDDEDMIWEVVINMLSELGYEVVLAENGKEAVEICAENKGAVDLVILDMLMPVMNAHEAFPLLKQNNPDIKVLLASGYVEEEDVQDLLAAGALGFMRKPYRLKDLARKIRDILDKNS